MGVNTRAAYARFLASASGSASGNSHDRRRTRRERRRRRQMQQTKEQFQVKLTKEEQRRLAGGPGFVAAARGLPLNFSLRRLPHPRFREPPRAAAIRGPVRGV